MAKLQLKDEAAPCHSFVSKTYDDLFWCVWYASDRFDVATLCMASVMLGDCIDFIATRLELGAEACGTYTIVEMR